MASESPRERHERAQLYANTILQVAALFAVASVAFTAAFNYVVCWQGTWRLFIAFPAGLLALGVFRCALFLVETASGVASDGSDDTLASRPGPVGYWLVVLLVFAVQASILEIVFHTYRASYQPPVCEAELPSAEWLDAK